MNLIGGTEELAAMQLVTSTWLRERGNEFFYLYDTNL
jgi:hypothetical protein